MVDHGECFSLSFQFYIVSGGVALGSYVTSTEILKKEGGSSWQMVASLPSARGAFRGVSLPNGHFMVSGEVQRCPCFIYGT